jgi:ubiquinol-cytochrome c reductase iron-sulfur subunit
MSKKQSKSGTGSAPDVSFNSDSVNPGRRRLLVGSASVVGGVGAAALIIPMLGSMSPSARAKAAGAPVEADISKLTPGQLLLVEWRGKPVWVIKRTAETLKNLAEFTENLRDPNSDEDQQPAYAKNTDRSIKPELLVVIGICTHLGCSPTYRPEIAPADLGSDWRGGFFCPCHGSRFDMAGRVVKGVPAPTNLEIPPYKFLDENLIVVGVDEGAVA